MPQVNIIGIGPGNTMSVTQEAHQALLDCCCLIGDQRMISSYAYLGKSVFYSSRVEEILDYLESYGKNDPVAILVSGDVGFFSLTKILLAKMKEEDKEKVKLYCGIGSLQYFCSRLKTSWDDTVTLSLHGRNGNIVSTVMNHQKVFVLTGGTCTPAEVCKLLCKFGLGSVKVSVGENLSYENERISTATAEIFATEEFDALSVVMVFNDRPLVPPFTTHGLPDELFLRGDVPMTKQEIRSVTLSKLQLNTTDTAYDIGAGTGSVAIEMALQLTAGFVYAVEKDQEALELIRKNKEKFGTANLCLISATAPNSLDALPKPDKVFIGGSSGNLKDILNTVYSKNPDVRVVVNAITLETLNEAIQYYNNKPDLDVEIINISISKSRKLGDYHLMTGQNPVFIITAQRSVVSSQ